MYFVGIFEERTRFKLGGDQTGDTYGYGLDRKAYSTIQ